MGVVRERTVHDGVVVDYFPDLDEYVVKVEGEDGETRRYDVWFSDARGGWLTQTGVGEEGPYNSADELIDTVFLEQAGRR